MTFIVGSGVSDPCPVCDLSPVGLREIPGFARYGECARCGLTYALRGIASLAGDGESGPPAPAVSATFASVLRTYWRQNQRKLGPPPVLLEEGSVDPERLERMRALDRWLSDHPQLLAGASAPASWPYVSLTVVVVQPHPEEPVFWSILAPPHGMTSAPVIPFPATDLPVGTIVTISIPIPIEEPGPESDGDGSSRLTLVQ